MLGVESLTRGSFDDRSSSGQKWHCGSGLWYTSRARGNDRGSGASVGWYGRNNLRGSSSTMDAFGDNVGDVGVSCAPRGRGVLFLRDLGINSADKQLLHPDELPSGFAWVLWGPQMAQGDPASGGLIVEEGQQPLSHCSPRYSCVWLLCSGHGTPSVGIGVVFAIRPMRLCTEPRVVLGTTRFFQFENLSGCLRPAEFFRLRPRSGSWWRGWLVFSWGCGASTLLVDKLHASGRY